jgi:signal transduction histidine kinase
MATCEPSVLIVDDNREKLVALEAILRELPCEIVQAGSGEEALHRILQRDFAVILVDVRMDGTDGLETAALIRGLARSERTPIIFIASPDEADAERGYSLGAVDCIRTPVAPDVLRTKVSVLVDLYRATAEVRREAEALRHRAGQLQRLTAASLAISAAGSLDRMLQVVTSSARDILGADRAIAIATVDGRRLHRAACPPLPGVTDEEIVRAQASLVCPTNLACRAAGELAVPFVDGEGRNIGLVQVARGGTDEIAPEDENILIQLARMASIAIENTLFCEAREANRLKDEFLATVSHELRTPLNAMVSWAWMLRTGMLGADGIARAAEAIERSVKAQARIIDDLLDVSRIVSGKLRLRSRVVDLVHVIDPAIDSVIGAANAKGIRLVRAFEPAGATVLGDPGRLQQVVWNLLSNAIKFTARGGRIEVGLRRAGDEVELRVSDDGQGISPSFLPHVFERFRQADGSLTRRAGGLGLGLSIVHHLVELHGGRVEAESRGEGCGATFTIGLPLASPPVDATAPANGPGATDGSPRLDGVGVLLVEDEPDTRDAVCLVLSRAGARVVGVGSADEALLAFQQIHPDVLVCNLALPDEDGYSLLRRIRAVTDAGTGFVPAVALTAYAEERDQLRARRAGFQSHVAKPVEPDELLRVLARVARSGFLPEGRELAGGGGQP